MFIEAIVLGVILGYLRGGKINNLNRIELRFPVALIATFIIEIILRLYSVNFNNSIANLIFDNYMYIHIVFYIIVIAILTANDKLKYMKIIQGGYILNLLPMMFNGGKMPISESALIRVGQSDMISFLKEGLIPTHQLIDSSTRFWQLSDFIPMKYPIAKVISPGDIVLSLGLILFIYHNMKSKEV
ncbi:MAG: DUF5317 domain-containing protein [Tissierellia bacterium]|nr:DUF5317 domain-containing protein [Tissierellia bacterium]